MKINTQLIFKNLKGRHNAISEVARRAECSSDLVRLVLKGDRPDRRGIIVIASEVYLEMCEKQAEEQKAANENLSKARALSSQNS